MKTLFYVKEKLHHHENIFCPIFSHYILDRFIKNSPCIYFFSNFLSHQWIAREVYFMMVEVRVDRD